jgi:hypothetical protein
VVEATVAHQRQRFIMPVSRLDFLAVAEPAATGLVRIGVGNLPALLVRGHDGEAQMPRAAAVVPTQVDGERRAAGVLDNEMDQHIFAEKIRALVEVEREAGPRRHRVLLSAPGRSGQKRQAGDEDGGAAECAHVLSPIPKRGTTASGFTAPLLKTRMPHPETVLARLRK